MIKGLCLATIWSEDLNNLLPFYRDVVGLTPGLETPGFVILGDPAGPSLALGTHSEVHGPSRDPARHMVGPGDQRYRGRGIASQEPGRGVHRGAD